MDTALDGAMCPNPNELRYAHTTPSDAQPIAQTRPTYQIQNSRFVDSKSKAPDSKSAQLGGFYLYLARF